MKEKRDMTIAELINIRDKEQKKAKRFDKYAGNNVPSRSFVYGNILLSGIGFWVALGFMIASFVSGNIPSALISIAGMLGAIGLASSAIVLPIAIDKKSNKHKMKAKEYDDYIKSFVANSENEKEVVEQNVIEEQKLIIKAASKKAEKTAPKHAKNPEESNNFEVVNDNNNANDIVDNF